MTALGGLLLGTSLPTNTIAALVASIEEGLSFEQFLVEANPLATSIVADISASGQDRYLRAVARIAAKLNGVPVPAKWNDTDQGLTPQSYQIGVNPGGDPFTVLQWRLEPGAVCRPHAHTYGNVVTLGIEGRAQVKNYEVVGQPDYQSSDSFQVIETRDQLLGPGDINLVSLQRNYIHGFVAGPDGARGLDITTRLQPRPDHGTPYLALGRSVSSELARTYEGSWVYN